LNFKVHPVAKGVKTTVISRKESQLPVFTKTHNTIRHKGHFCRLAEKSPQKSVKTT
tara:strand:+ start:1170 stop:1337 length:168 start_codon:yes stop_codon:yes gene_type:complete